MDLNLRDKVVVITGGTSGIGKETALAFAEEGARVVICGRNPNKIVDVEKYFEEKGYSVLALSVDVANNAQLKQFADTVFAKMGRIDIWVNNAGIDTSRRFTEFSEEEWHNMVNIDFKAVYYGSAYASEYMRKTGGGVILNTSSFTTLVPTAGYAIYSAAKSAVNSLTRTLAAELAADNIRVVGVIPGYIQTGMTAAELDRQYEEEINKIPMRRFGTPEDLAYAFLFLASDKASYINGVLLPVSGAKYCTQNPQWSWRNPRQK